MLLGDLIYRVGADIKSFDTEMAKVSKTLLKLDRESQKSLAWFDRIGQRLSDVGTTLSVALTLPMAAAGTAALKMAGDFEGAMNRVSALGDIAGQDLADLQKQAMELGKATQFSAQQAAEGMGELAAASFETTEIMSAMPGILQLAAAGQMSVAESALIVKDTIGQFGLTAADTTRIVDTLAAASLEGSASMSQIGTTLSYVGVPAKNAGQSLEEVTAAIVALDIAGLRGERAGTGLRGVFDQLLAPTKKAAAHMKQLEISISDSSGKILPLSDIMEQFRTKLQGVGSDVERSRIIFETFGREAGGAAQILINTGGPALDEFEAKIKRQGAAAEIAARLNQGLGFAWEQLKGSLETAGIALGQVLIPLTQQALGILTQFLNEAVIPAVEWFKQLPEPVKTTALAIAGLTAAAGPALFITGQLAQSFVALNAAFGLVIKALPLLTGAGGISALTGAFGGLVTILSGPVGVIALIGAGLAGAAYVAYQAVQKLDTALDQQQRRRIEQAKAVDDVQKKEADRTFEVLAANQKLEKQLQAQGITVTQGTDTLDQYNKRLQGLVVTKQQVEVESEEITEWNKKIAESFKKADESGRDLAGTLSTIAEGDTAKKLETAWFAITAGAERFREGQGHVYAMNRALEEMAPVLTPVIPVMQDLGSEFHLLEASILSGMLNLSHGIQEVPSAITYANDKSLETISKSSKTFFKEQEDGWKTWTRQVSTIVSDFGKQTAELFISLFKSDPHNEQLEKQESDLRASLTQRESAYADYAVEIAESIESATAKSAGELAKQEASLHGAFDDKRAEYESYASDIGAKIEELTAKHENAADREIVAAEDSLRQQFEAYDEYVQQVEGRIEDLDQSFARQEEDAAARARHLNEDSADSLDDRKGDLNRNIADKKKAYDRDTAELNRKIAKELAKGKSANQESVSDWRESLKEKEEDYNEYIRRQQEDFSKWVSDHQRGMERQIEALNTAATRRKEDLNEQKTELQDNVTARREALEQARIATETKVAEIRAVHAAELDAEVGDLNTKLAEKKAAFDQYSIDLGPKLDALRAAHAAELAGEVEDFNAKLAEKKAALDAWITNDFQPKLNEIESSFTGVWDRVGAAFTGMLTGAAEAITRFGTEALVGGLFKWFTGEGGLLSHLGKVGDAIAGIFGSGGGAAAEASGGAAGGIGGAAGGAGSAASGVVGGILNSLGNIGGIVSAVSSVIGLFHSPLAGDTGKIEVNTRGTLQQLRDGIQPKLNDHLPKLDAISGYLWDVGHTLWVDISASLDMIEEDADAISTTLRNLHAEIMDPLHQIRDTISEFGSALTGGFATPAIAGGARIEVHISNNTFRDRSDIDYLMTEFDRRFRELYKI